MTYKRKHKRYKIGQVVLLNVDFYKKERIAQQYQKIINITNWPLPFGGDCLTFANGDQCHEKYVRSLNEREINA